MKAFKHWLLPDHLSFLALFPVLVWWIVTPSHAIFLGACALYWFTLLYDVAEEKIACLKTLELRLKNYERKTEALPQRIAKIFEDEIRIEALQRIVLIGAANWPIGEDFSDKIRRIEWKVMTAIDQEAQMSK